MYGIDGYGRFVSVTSGALIITIILDFGYTQGLPKHILKGYISAKNSVFLVLVSKVLFFIFLSPFVVLFFDNYLILILLSLVSILSVEPIMLGLDKYKEMLKYQFISKLLYLIGVLFIYWRGLDVIYLFVIYALSLFTFNLFCVLSILYDNKLPIYSKVKFSLYKNVIKDCFKFYISKSFVNIYQQTSVFFVSIFCSEQLTGYYALSNQLYKVAQGVIGSISKVYYTRMLKTKKIIEMIKVIKLVSCFYFLGWGVILFRGESILSLISSGDMSTLFNVSVIFYSALFFVIISSFFGYPYLTPIGKENYSHMALILSTVTYFSLFLMSYYTGFISVYGFAVMIFLADLTGGVFRLFYAIKFRRMYYEF